MKYQTWNDLTYQEFGLWATDLVEGEWDLAQGAHDNGVSAQATAKDFLDLYNQAGWDCPGSPDTLIRPLR